MGTSIPSDWESLDYLDLLQEPGGIVYMEPRGGRAKGEGVLIDLGRRVVDCAERFQEETLAVICPFTNHTCLYNKREYSFQWVHGP